MRQRPGLRCYILVWDYGTLYALERDPLTRWRLGWRMPRGVRFGFDDHHPVGASHHQKVVVVDDMLAFCGGIDLTGHRWDTSAHRPDEPSRVTPVGVGYGPYHEVQMMVEGPIAAALGELSRGRWRALGARGIPHVAPASCSLWPADLPADFTDVTVGIARTVPGSASVPAIRECETLFLDSIAAAEREIYIESQYFTSARLTAALADRLKERDGPELIVVSPNECHGWLEKNTMGAFRDAQFRTLINADVHKRLRLVQPMASRSRDCPVFVHSKVMVVDDRLLRIGSANFSNRSLGMDTECDLAVEAADAREARAVRRVRDRMVGEHLGMEADEVATAIEKLGSLREVIDSCADRDRSLLRLEVAPEAEPVPEAVQATADPEEPIGFGGTVERLLPATDPASSFSHLRMWILPAVAIIAALVVGWPAYAEPVTLARMREALEAFPSDRALALTAVFVFIAAAQLLIPIELLIIVAFLIFGVWPGSLVALAGSLGAAAAGYAGGRLLGPTGLARWISPSSYRLGRQLCVNGPAAAAGLNLAAVGAAGSLYFVCGASRIRFGSYLVGNALGLLPMVIVLGPLGSLLRYTFLHPTMINGLITMGAAVGLTAIAAVMRTLLKIRQYAPLAAGQRSRAEFG